ncbi:MAG: urease accessory protein UreE [Methylobacteriaceae bacterium]|nr:urease accessory protein UreE [Methylobacteriaceae bacterium]MBV9245643.1 urease accessory protein UreE [Methylobacteriaceae bacterium]MBV9704668.1 urease accessory protein UreE [Methylobacteriaceae bacterium]
MLRATSVKARGSWNGEVADSVVLDHDERHRRRITMTGTHGTGFLLDLAEAIMLRGGDALVLDDGRLVEVVAAPEPLVEIRCGDAEGLLRIAWHLGNRHLPLQIAAGRLRMRRDAVIEEMVRGLGAKVTAIEAPFDPEGGAYAVGVAHHDHDHHHHGHGEHPHDHGDRHHHRSSGEGHGQSHEGRTPGDGHHGHSDGSH